MLISGIFSAGPLETAVQRSGTVDFEAPAVQQAKVLLRHVGTRGILSQSPLSSLPSPLDGFMSDLRSRVPTPDAVRSYFRRNHLNSEDFGDLPPYGDALPDSVRYFVIHDTSSPNYAKNDFPSDINEPGWTWNHLKDRWAGFQRTHVFTNRVGGSLTIRDFNQPLPRSATRWESRDFAARGKHFVHVENTQPRRSLPGAGSGNDAQGPNPGFTAAQYERLALLYISASARRGQWLIPAFHAAVDDGITGGHDDPQNFDLSQWAQQVEKALSEIPAQGLAHRIASSYDPPEASRERLGRISFTGATEENVSLKGLARMYTLRSGALYIHADMDIDADGSPRAKVIDPKNGQLETSLAYKSLTGQARYLDSERVLYIALPYPLYKSKWHVKLGDVAAVIYGDKIAYAVVADSGPSNLIGEGSVKLAQALGHDPFVVKHGKRVVGSSIPKDVIYIVFPGTRDPNIKPGTVNSISQQIGSRGFAALGGRP